MTDRPRPGLGCVSKGTPSQLNTPQGLGGLSRLWLSGPTLVRALGFDFRAGLVAVIVKKNHAPVPASARHQT